VGRINERALNSAAFLAAMLCLFLPFVKLNVPWAVGTGGLWWTGGDLLVGGAFGEDIVLLRLEDDGSRTPDPITFARLYGQDFQDTLLAMPWLLTAALAGLLVMAGAVAAQMRAIPVRVGAAAVAAAALAVLALAQWQALTQVADAWTAAGQASRGRSVGLLQEPEITSSYGFWTAASLLGAVILGNAALILAQRWSRIDANIEA
jgi:hypothetical protein